MKKILGTFLSLPILLSGCAGGEQSFPLGTLLLALAAVLLLTAALLRTRAWKTYNRRRARKGRRPVKLDPLTWLSYVLAVLALAGALLLLPRQETVPEQTPPAQTDSQTQTTPPQSLFCPAHTDDTDPDNWSVRWEIFENGLPVHSYTRPEPISFGAPADYFALPGVAAFRGNNYRDSAAWGAADIRQEDISLRWSVNSTNLPGGIWEGSGWTGQPLVVQWDEATRQLMNLYPNKKSKTDLVEVIYATLDGHIYFLDLDDGSATRDPINMGMCFKGSGSLDPRGYPILYVGAGDENINGQRPRMYVISLIDGSILFQYGHEESLSYRQDNDRWCAFDSSPLVHADTDTLIWPGESGLLYTLKLNTRFDKTSGALSVSPDKPVCTRYLAGRSNQQTYWLGYEASANIVENYLYVSENGGLFYCVDLNTMELIWVQDTRDDSNSSPVFQRLSDTQAYVYTAPSLHWTQDSQAQGSVSIFKLDALTGEILWEKPFRVHTVDGISGGIQSTGLLGKAGTDLENMIVYTVSRTPTKEAGVMIALDTATGNTLWTLDMAYYTWSSPVAVYTPQGKGYIVVCDTAGSAMLVDGATGKVLSKTNLGGLVEASPVVYEDVVVVGTRGKKIIGLTLS